MAEPQCSGATGTSPHVNVEEWLELYGDRLLRSAWLLCGNEGEAGDLVQETFLQALKSAHRFRGDSGVYSWLHGILLNVWHTYLRTRKRFVFDPDVAQQEPVQDSGQACLDELFCNNQLAEAIRRLSPEHREVVVLRYYEDLKLQEIARRTGASLGTVKSRLHYALLRLQQFLPREMNLLIPFST